jgi:hypothetical protein
MNNILKSGVLCLTLFTSISVASAGSTPWTQVAWISVGTGGGTGGHGVACIHLPAPISGVAGCGAGQPYRFAVDLGTESGREILRTAREALLNRREVIIFGKGTCGVWGDTESVDYMGVH